MRDKLSTREREERDRNIVKDYSNGVSQMEICQKYHVSARSVKAITQEAGVFVENRVAKLAKEKNNYQTSIKTSRLQQKDSQMITRKHLKKAIQSISVGDRFWIRTEKGITIKDNDSNVYGAVREVEVVNKDNPVFCRVRLISSGIEESVMWQDIYVAMRDGKNIVN